jgi:endonuclease/exonuclease/phosphatase family metal-dependent hydrolase
MVRPLSIRVLSLRLLVAGSVAAIVLAGCAQMYNYLEQETPRFSGSFAVVQPGTPEVITIASYNIKLGDEVERALAELTSHAEVNGAEILLLQEMDEAGTERIARTLAYNYVYYPASVHTATDRNFGNAVLSRYPIVSDNKILLPHGNFTRGQRRIAVRALVEFESTCVQVVSVHTENLSLSIEKRLEQVQALLDVIPASPHLAIVGGDFNTIEAPAASSTVSMFKEKGFEWVSESAGATASFAVIDVQSDHVFTRGFNEIRAGHIEEANASDHKPIWIDVSFTDPVAASANSRGCSLSDRSEESPEGA